MEMKLRKGMEENLFCVKKINNGSAYLPAPDCIFVLLRPVECLTPVRFFCVSKIYNLKRRRSYIVECSTIVSELIKLEVLEIELTERKTVRLVHSIEAVFRKRKHNDLKT